MAKARKTARKVKKTAREAGSKTRRKVKKTARKAVNKTRRKREKACSLCGMIAAFKKL